MCASFYCIIIFLCESILFIFNYSLWIHYDSENITIKLLVGINWHNHLKKRINIYDLNGKKVELLRYQENDCDIDKLENFYQTQITNFKEELFFEQITKNTNIDMTPINEAQETLNKLVQFAKTISINFNKKIVNLADSKIILSRKGEIKINFAGIDPTNNTTPQTSFNPEQNRIMAQQDLLRGI